MKLLYHIAFIVCIAVFSSLSAEQLFAESNSFSFPVISSVTTPKIHKKPTFFRQTGIQPNSRTLSFSWSIPTATAKQKGVITVYSLLGRIVTRIPIDGNSGTATWHLSGCRSGIYIARLTLNSTIHNLKLMLWN